MRPARPGGSPVVIEFAGLPGAGKTSVADRVSIPHAGRRDITSLNLPLRPETWRVARAAFALAFSIRPWKPSYLLRAIRLVLALRCYGEGKHRLVIMDQGLVQKLWSMVIETRSYSARRLEDLVRALSPFMADQLVWVAVPHHLAAERIVNRRGGNSRFDGKAYDGIVNRLQHLESVYQHIIGLFHSHIDLPVVPLDGEAELGANALKIENLIDRLRQSTGTSL